MVEYGCNFGGLRFFDPVGWRYHLPAYIVRSLESLDQNTWAFDVLCKAVYSVTPDIDGQGECDSFSLERYATLNAPQCEAIRAFLEYLLEHCPEYSEDPQIERALARLWDTLPLGGTVTPELPDGGGP